MSWSEQQPDLPAGWEWAEFGSLTNTQLGKMLSKVSKTGVDERPYLRNQNVQWGRFVLDDLATMAFTDLEVQKFALEPGDLIVCEGGEVGRAAVWNGPTGVFYQKALHRVRPLAGLDVRFLMYALRRMTVGDLLDGFTSGSTIAHLPQEDLRRLPVPVPPAAEQERIVAELERRFAHLDAVERGLSVAARKAQVAHAATLSAVADGTLLGLDSADWRSVTTGEIADVRGGIQKQPKRAPNNNSHPFLRVANVGRGTLDLEVIHQIELFGDEIDTYRLAAGDLLVVEGNGSVEQIGRAAVWDGSIPDCVHQNHLIRVRPGPDILPGFLGLTWNAPSTAEQLIAVASSTSGLHTLSVKKVKSVVIALPDTATQAKLIAEAERRLSLIDSCSKEIGRSIDRVSALRRSLLVAAFSGRLVPQDPDDEPASELLARIAKTRAEAEAAEKETKAAARRANKAAKEKTA